MKTFFLLSKEQIIKTNLFLLAAVPFLDGISTLRLAEIAITISLIQSFTLSTSSRIPTIFVGLTTALATLYITSDISNISSHTFRQTFQIVFIGIYMYCISLNICQGQEKAFYKTVIFFSAINGFAILIIGLNPELFPPGHSNNVRSLMGFTFWIDRSSGLFTIYAYAATYMISALGYLILLKEYNISKIRTSVIFALITSTLILMQSRLTWLSLIVFILLSVCYTMYQKGKKTTSFISLFLALIIPISILPYLIAIKESSYNARIEHTKEAINLWQESPILGPGYTTFFQSNPDYFIHNGWAVVLFSTGIIGITLTVAIWLTPYLLKKTRNNFFRNLMLLLPAAIIFSGSGALSFYAPWMVIASLNARRFTRSGKSEKSTNT